ncbi:MAG: elongation factor P [Myxococcota bacterium]
MYSTQDFRKGLKIEIDGDPYVIVDFQHVNPGKGGAFVRTKLKSLTTGRVIDPTFKAGDKVKKPDTSEDDVQFLYTDGDAFHFMDVKTFEQHQVAKEYLGDAPDFLKPEMKVTLLFFNGRAIGIDLPNFVELKVTKCDPGVRGDTVSGATKPATLETGATFNVPLFVNEGDTIRVDTRSHEYVSRVEG